MMRKSSKQLKSFLLTARKRIRTVGVESRVEELSAALSPDRRLPSTWVSTEPDQVRLAWQENTGAPSHSWRKVRAVRPPSSDCSSSWPWQPPSNRRGITNRSCFHARR